MTRSEWISGFITLAVAGLAYYIRGPKTAITCIVIGVIGTLLFHFFSKSEQKSAPINTAVKDSLNPVQSQQFNPTFSPNITVHSHLGPELAASPTPPSMPRREKAPNLQFVGVRVGNIAILEDYNSGTIAQELHQNTQTKAIIAAFRNKDNGGNVSTAFDVVARIFLKAKDGSELGTGISQGVWLDTYDDSVGIALEDTKHLVLLAMDRGTEAYVPYKHGRQYGEVPVPVSDLAEIEIKLVDTRNSSVLHTKAVRLDADLEGNILKP